MTQATARYSRDRRDDSAFMRVGGPTPAPYDLSRRELAVLAYLTEGMTDMQIAFALGVTKFTINKHVGAILIKMEVTSRTGAAVRAIREAIVA